MRGPEVGQEWLDLGAQILRRGGNAVDAAVAVGYALAVTHPCCGNLGGGGFLLAHLADGRNIFINFREKAPSAARADMFLDSQGNAINAESRDGYLAVGVPGTVLGLETAAGLGLENDEMKLTCFAEQGLGPWTPTPCRRCHWRCAAGVICAMPGSCQ